MALIKGMTVVLREKIMTGKDPFNDPIYEYVDKEVENVLIAPASTDDIVSSQNLYGKKAVYTLAIPKGDTNTWTDNIVVFFGKEWQVFGIPMEGMTGNIPLDWDKKVMVKRYE